MIFKESGSRGIKKCLESGTGSTVLNWIHSPEPDPQSGSGFRRSKKTMDLDTIWIHSIVRGDLKQNKKFS